MAKVGFWLKGSTGKLAGTTLYKGADGETYQREVVTPSNPKTVAQNIQRVVMSTVGAAYRTMKDICDHSFEGVKKGQETMSLFMSENIQKCRAAIETMQAQGVLFLNMYNFVPVGQKNGFAVNQYLVSMGSLPNVPTRWILDETDNFLYATVPTIANNTYQEIIDKFGLQRGDQLTFCSVTGQGSTAGNTQFHFARVILDPTSAEYLPLPLSTPFLDENGNINAPSVRNEGSFKFKIVADAGLRYWYEDARLVDQDAIAAFVIVSRKQGDIWARSTTYMTYSNEQSAVCSLQECLDAIGSGAQHQIYTGNAQYLNNAGEGGGAAAESGEQSSGGGSSQGGGSTSNNFVIGSTSVNGSAMTVGTAKSVMCSEGETTAALQIVMNFSNVGDATSVLLFNGSTQVGTEHAISNGAVNFTADNCAIGSYALKVKKSDNSLVASGYTINVVAYSAGGGGTDWN